MQVSQSSGKNNEASVKLYKEALQRVKILIDSEVQSHQRMSTLTTKFVLIIDQVNCGFTYRDRYKYEIYCSEIYWRTLQCEHMHF